MNRLLPSLAQFAVLACLVAVPAAAQPPRFGSGERSAMRGDLSVEALLEEADAALAAADSVRRALDPNLPAAAPPDDDAFRLVPETIHLARIYLGGGRQSSRYLALSVWLVNPTEEAITIEREAFRLTIPGKQFTPGAPPDRPGIRQLAIGEERLPLEEIRHEGEVAVDARSASKVIVVFYDLPSTTEVPQMVLELPHEEHPAAVNLNALALGRMKPDIGRIGPKGMLGIVTIGGPIGDVAAGGLVEILRQLVQKRTTRVVLAWTGTAPKVRPETINWLAQYASQRGGHVGVGRDGQHPALPTELADLRFAELPEQTYYHNRDSWAAAHETLPEAVRASLAGPFEAIPIQTLRAEMMHGGDLTRPVAIAAGGRLPESDLPLLLEWSRDDDSAISTAALAALGGFPHEAAIERLREAAREGSRDAQEAAIEALAASAYGAAHEALHEMLDDVVASRSEMPLDVISNVLARYPRALWRDVLFELSFRGDPSDRRVVLVALARVGHPRILESLGAALETGETALEHQALELLIDRSDQQSQQLALDYTLEHLEDELPTGPMTELLRRVKDRRAVPLMLEEFEELEKAGEATDQIMRHIPLLAEIGGHAARERIEDLYDDVSPMHRSNLLRLLEQMNSPRLLEFAEKAVRSDHASLTRSGMLVFQSVATDEAVEILARMLTTSDDRTEVNLASESLKEIGSTEALLALRQAWHREGEWRDMLRLDYFRARQEYSPAWQVYQKGEQFAKDRQWDEALEQFASAARLDPTFVEAYSGQAHANMKLENHEQARADYEHVLELDPRDPEAITCLAILQVVDGNVDEGLRYLDEHADQFQNNPLYAYNTACTKALAADHIGEEDARRAESLRVKAVRELERSIELGMDDERSLAWAREDPDLVSLHGREDFERVLDDAED